MEDRFTSNTRWVRTSWLVSALGYTAAAILCFVSDKDQMVAISDWLGAAMMLNGVLNIRIYLFRREAVLGAPWLLADGMMTALLSMYLLFNQMITPEMIPFFFGCWEVFSGVLRSVDSIEQKDEKIRGWKLFCGIGLLELLSGGLAMVKPIEEYIAVNLILTFVFSVQAVAFFHRTAIYPRLLVANHRVFLKQKADEDARRRTVL